MIIFFVVCLKMYLYFVDFLWNGYEVLILDGFIILVIFDGKVVYFIKLVMFKIDFSIFFVYCLFYCKKFYNYFEINIYSIVKN